jgi:DNA-binding YbaB/EbfC family protein
MLYLFEERAVKGGMGNLMKQAQQMQQKMLKMQEELAQKTLEASVGGGMVTVTVNGKNEVLRVKIEPQVVDPDDVEMLEDLIVAGVNEALRKAQEMIAEEMSKLTGGMKIPGLF